VVKDLILFLKSSDLLWSDPMNEDEDIVIDEENMFQYNELRGCSFIYSYLAVETFLKNNNLLSVIRAHEAQDHGYKLYKADPVTQFPMIICIFSAPNYCDAYRNLFLFLNLKVIKLQL
jgi:serine/threonine-protein phosphatase 2B catalytic subunit